MENFFRKSVLAGLGLFETTKEKVEEFVDEMIKKGEVTQEDRSQYIKETLDKVDERAQEAKAWVTAQVEDAWEKIKPKTAEQITHLQAKIDALSAELNELKEKLTQKE